MRLIHHNIFCFALSESATHSYSKHITSIDKYGIPCAKKAGFDRSPVEYDLIIRAPSPVQKLNHLGTRKFSRSLPLLLIANGLQCCFHSYDPIGRAEKKIWLNWLAIIAFSKYEGAGKNGRKKSGSRNRKKGEKNRRAFSRILGSFSDPVNYLIILPTFLSRNLTASPKIKDNSRHLS